VEPESYLQDFSHDNFLLNRVNPDLVCKIISSLETKTSFDIDGFNTKVLMVKSIPLAHIFNLSFETGIVPSK